VQNYSLNPVETWFSDAGASPSRIAWTIALGFAVGMFPILGITTICCALLAKFLGLKQGPIQLGNYAALPFQIIGLIPFLRLGERALHAPRFEFDPGALLRQMPHIPDETMRAFVYAQWHMIVGWMLIAPLAAVVVGMTLSVLFKRRFPKGSEAVAVRG
jgi:hypothetical protein